MEITEDAAYDSWEFLKIARAMRRLKEMNILDDEACLRSMRRFKEQLQLEAPAETLCDDEFVTSLEILFGSDAASCPITSVQAKWKAR